MVFSTPSNWQASSERDGDYSVVSFPVIHERVYLLAEHAFRSLCAIYSTLAMIYSALTLKQQHMDHYMHGLVAFKLCWYEAPLSDSTPCLDNATLQLHTYFHGGQRHLLLSLPVPTGGESSNPSNAKAKSRHDVDAGFRKQRASSHFSQVSRRYRSASFRLHHSMHLDFYHYYREYDREPDPPARIDRD